MENNKTDIYIFSLSSIQKIITRLSNIGYALFTITLTFLSIIASITFSLNLDSVWKLLISIISCILIVIFFIVNIINLRNEKAFREIYNNKTKLNIDDSSVNEILSLTDFTEIKNKIKLINCIKSFLTWMWIGVSLLPLSMLMYSIFLFF